MRTREHLAEAAGRGGTTVDGSDLPSPKGFGPQYHGTNGVAPVHKKIFPASGFGGGFHAVVPVFSLTSVSDRLGQEWNLRWNQRLARWFHFGRDSEAPIPPPKCCFSHPKARTALAPSCSSGPSKRPWQRSQLSIPQAPGTVRHRLRFSGHARVRQVHVASARGSFFG